MNMRIKGCLLLLGLLLMSSLAAIQPVKAAGEYYVGNWEFASTTESWQFTGTKSGMAWQDVAGEDMVNGVLRSPSGSSASTATTAIFYYEFEDLSQVYMATNQCYVRAWYKVDSTAYSSSTTIYITLQIEDTIIDQDSYVQSASTDRYGTLEGWATIPTSGDLKLNFTASGTGFTWFAIADNVRVYWGSAPDYTYYLLMKDESTDAALTSATTFYGSITTSTYVGDPYVVNTNSTGYITIMSWDGTLHSVKIGKGEFGILGLDPWYRSIYDPTGSTFTMYYPSTAMLEDVPTQGWMIVVVDNTDDYSQGDYFLALKELGGVNATIDQKPLSWALTTYSGMVGGEGYYLVVNSSDGTNEHLAGYRTILDNPTYIEIGSSAGDDINSTALDPQVWNTTITANYTAADPAGDFWKMVAQDGEVGAWILLGLPLLFMVMAGAHYAFASGMIACAICAAINAAIGYPWYNTAILGWIAATCLLMVIRDAMKSDGGGSGNR